MINILLNDTDFFNAWCYSSLSHYLKKDTHVLVIALTRNDGWSLDEEEWEHQFSKGGKIYQRIVHSFKQYQIEESNIEWFIPNRDSKRTLENQLKKADVIYLYGNEAESFMERVHDLSLFQALSSYQGIVISNAVGSLVQMDVFDSMYAYEEEPIQGLGLLEGFALVSDYKEDAGTLARIIRHIEQRGKSVIAFGKDGGAIIDHGSLELLGNAYMIDEADLDAVYRAYEDAKSRFEYYGDNGLW